MTDPKTTGAPRGPGSFCIPRAAFEALLDANATVYEIGAYLVLANHTDETGRYSTASISAINRRTGANKVRGGPAHKAVDRLKAIRATRIGLSVSNGRSGKAHAMVEQRQDLGPILVDRSTWCAETGEAVPDGPTPRGAVLFILPDFGEPIDARIWFNSNLVAGIRHFDRPLRALINAGDVAARLLLALYAVNDMETWGGVRPVGNDRGPSKRYKSVDTNAIPQGNARLIRAKDNGTIADIDKRISGAGDVYWSALEALQSAGLVYEVVMVLNREAITRKFASGEEYQAIPDDAEPYYELDCRSRHGYKPEGEWGIGGATASTAGKLGFPVTARNEQEWEKDGSAAPTSVSATFDGTYAAIVPAGYPAMIAGIFRLRFRVSNTQNAGVKGTWARIYENNRQAFEFVQAVRAANGLQPLKAPWAREKERTAEPESPTLA